MRKYKTACSSLRPGQLNKMMTKIKDFNPIKSPEELNEKYKNNLWCDLKTDQQKVEFLKSGRAFETGIIAQVVVDDIVSLYEHAMKIEENK